MTRLPLIALLSAATLATVAPAAAQAQTAFYVATPTDAAGAKPRLMTRSTPWTLRDGTYLAARAAERPLVLCQLLARETGALSGFSAGGTALTAEDLAKCNARAKSADTTTAAR